jgi:hypothetical protein
LNPGERGEADAPGHRLDAMYACPRVKHHIARGELHRAGTETVFNDEFAAVIFVRRTKSRSKKLRFIGKWLGWSIA